MRVNIIMFDPQLICKKTSNPKILKVIKKAVSKKSKSVIKNFVYIDGDPIIYKQIFLN